MLENMGKPGGPQVIICSGSGGVGKTTVSAAIGLHGAVSGLKTIVLTVDPARHLSDFLGMGEAGGNPGEDAGEVPTDHLRDVPGRMFAMPLDAKKTFDQLIRRYAPKPRQQRIFANRYYRHLSANLPGTHEYMAMEKLYEVYTQDKWDLIVLDTPPSQKALDFLDAPERVLDLLGHQYVMKYLKPASGRGLLGGKVFGLVTNPIHKAISQLVGKQAMDDLVEFFILFNETLVESLQKRAGVVQSLLSDPVTTFVSVTTPSAHPMQEAVRFYNRLRERNLSFHGFIINRVHRFHEVNGLPAVLDPIAADDLFPRALVRELGASYERFCSQAKGDERKIEQFRGQVGPGAPMLEIPVQEFEVADVGGLMKIQAYLARDESGNTHPT